jgi:hypothetical protein
MRAERWRQIQDNHHRAVSLVHPSVELVAPVVAGPQPESINHRLERFFALLDPCFHGSEECRRVRLISV